MNERENKGSEMPGDRLIRDAELLDELRNDMNFLQTLFEPEVVQLGPVFDEKQRETNRRDESMRKILQRKEEVVDQRFYTLWKTVKVNERRTNQTLAIFDDINRWLKQTGTKHRDGRDNLGKQNSPEDEVEK